MCFEPFWNDAVCLNGSSRKMSSFYAVTSKEMQLIIPCYCPWETHRPRHGWCTGPSRWNYVGDAPGVLRALWWQHVEPIIPNFCIINYWLDLVGGIPTPLKNMKVKWGSPTSFRTEQQVPLFNGPPSNPPGFWPGHLAMGFRLLAIYNWRCFFVKDAEFTSSKIGTFVQQNMVVGWSWMASTWWFTEAIRGGLSPIELD